MDRQRILIIVAGVLAVLWGADRLLLSGSQTEGANDSQRVLSRLLSSLQQPADVDSGAESQGASVAVDTILARPLFAVSRRPPVIAAAPVREQRERPSRRPVSDDYQLLATVLRSNAVPVAIITNTRGGETTRLREGERVSGWQVSTITSTFVQFEADGEVSSLYLSAGGGSPSQGPGGGSPGNQPRRGEAVQPSQRLNVSAAPPGVVTPGTTKN